jgi:hypothetical protein
MRVNVDAVPSTCTLCTPINSPELRFTVDSVEEGGLTLLECGLLLMINSSDLPFTKGLH